MTNTLLYYLFTLLAFTGMILNIKKSYYGFVFWMASNLAFALQSLFLGVYNMTLLFMIQFLFSVWGLYTWR